tara:strand:+ start:3220 stop:3825 length:606 start_codon:yes stop_codon:yes gene_type:complete
MRIELGSALRSGNRNSLDKIIKSGLLGALGDDFRKNLAVPSGRGIRMNPSFRNIVKKVRDELEVQTPKSKSPELGGSAGPSTGGQLAKSWKVKTKNTVEGKTFEIVNVDPRAPELLPILEYGTRKKNYEISPRFKKSLSFLWENPPANLSPGPLHVQFRKVTHPGIRAGFFVRSARRRLRARTVKALKQLEKRWIKNASII